MKSIIHTLLFLSFCSTLGAARLPDLIEWEEPIKEIKTSPVKPEQESKVTKQELALQSLKSLKETVEGMTTLNPTHQLRMLSLLDEMLGKPDQAYLTFKKIQKEEGELWHNIRELYLSEVLGLEEETQNLTEQLSEKLYLEQLKVEKVAFCRSVKGFGIYDPYPGAIPTQKPVIIYVEIKNLAQVKELEQFQSSCRASFKIKNKEGNVVYEYTHQEPFDYLARSPLSDYYIWLRWTPVLPAGKYDMLMEIKDARASVDRTHRLSFELN